MRFLPALLLIAVAASAQQGAKNGEWPYYGADSGTTKYSSLDQINATNVKKLGVAWQWHADNFGKFPDHNWEVTPIMVGGVLYFTAGTRRDVVAVDGATGETLWMYRLDEGARGAQVARTNNRGLAYWSDGKGDNRIILISPGYQLVALDAKTGRIIPGFGTNGLVDLTQGLDRPVVKPGFIGASSPAIVVNDTVVVGAALLAGPRRRPERTFQAMCEASTFVQEKSCGPSTPSRSRARRGMKPGRTIPGRPRGTRARGRR